MPPVTYFVLMVAKEGKADELLELLLVNPKSEGMRLALDTGIGHEREYVRFWSGLRKLRSQR
jgi:hypothetical protein